VLQRFREDEFVTGYGAAFDAAGTTDDLNRVAELLPDEWLAAAARGSAADCAARVRDQFDAGADGVVLHGATPTELAPVLDAWRAVRPAERFAGLPVNPGRTA
jgi:5,10-methylenetetrahydromethanopterin reductase